MKKTPNSILFFCLFVLFSNAQDHHLKSKTLFFYDAKTEQIILIENDSLVIKTNTNEKSFLKSTAYPAILKEYRYFNINKRTFLAHEGCGPVLEYRNDSIVRIDNSFLHRSQNEAAKFVYNNEIYFFGGYGLFTFKNILTKFDLTSKEWVLIKTNGVSPSPMYNYIYKVINNKLILFEGENHDHKNINKVYVLNFNTLTWEHFDYELPEYFNQFKHHFVEDENGLYVFIMSERKVIYFNFKDNTWQAFETDFQVGIYDSKITKNTFSAINQAFLKNKKPVYKYQIYDINTIIKKPITSKKTFYYKKINYNLYALFLVGALIIIVLVFKKRAYFKFLKNRNIIFHYYIKSNTLFCKGKNVNDLNENNIKIFNTLFKYKNNYIPISEFNELFLDNTTIENYTTLVKRREKRLNEFLHFIETTSGLPLDDIYKERKKSDDKRVKEVKVLENKILFINK